MERKEELKEKADEEEKDRIIVLEENVEVKIIEKK